MFSEDEFEETEVGCKLCACTFLDQIELDYHLNVSHGRQGEYTITDKPS
jgi:hypothetical protein